MPDPVLLAQTDDMYSPVDVGALDQVQQDVPGEQRVVLTHNPAELLHGRVRHAVESVVVGHAAQESSQLVSSVGAELSHIAPAHVVLEVTEVELARELPEPRVAAGEERAG